MGDFELIGSIMIIHLMTLVSPGPDFIVAVKNSMTYSRKTGFWTALGFGMGIAVHITYCLAGLAVIISKSIIIFNLIKYIGAAYLIYLGVSALLAKRSNVNIEEQISKPDITPFKAVKIGFLTNVLNPKASMFFLSLFTLFISPDTSYFILAIISFMMIVMTILWFMLVAVFFTHPKVLKVYNSIQGGFHKTFGGILILIGIKLALFQR